MIKPYYLLLFALTLSFTACSDDEMSMDPPSLQNTWLLANWELSTSATFSYEGNVWTVYQDINLIENNGAGVVYSEDGTYESFGNILGTLQFSTDDEVSSIDTLEGEFVFGSGTYFQEGDTMTHMQNLSSGTQTNQYEIVHLSSDSLVLDYLTDSWFAPGEGIEVVDSTFLHRYSFIKE